MKKFNFKVNEFFLAKAEGYNVALCWVEQFNQFAVFDLDFSADFVKRAKIQIVFY